MQLGLFLAGNITQPSNFFFVTNEVFFMSWSVFFGFFFVFMGACFPYTMGIVMQCEGVFGYLLQGV